MKFCTVIRGLKSKIEFVWDKNLITIVNIYAQLVTLYTGIVDMHHEAKAWRPVYMIKQTSSKRQANMKHA